MNPRKTFDEDAIRELADNIEKQGLLQPITVRPITDKQFAVKDGVADFHTKYEIVCGERRFRAVSKLFDKWNDTQRDKTARFYETPFAKGRVSWVRCLD